MDMDFQGIPDLGKETLESRMALLEQGMAKVTLILEKLVEPKTSTVLYTPEKKPTTVSETQDDERGKPFFKTVEEVQEEKEAGS